MYIYLMRSFFLDFTNVIMSCHLRQFLSDTHAVEVSPVPEDCNMNPLHIGIMLYTVMINDHYLYHCNAFCLSHLRNAPSWMLLIGLFDKSRSLLHFCISFFVFLLFLFFVFFLFAISRSLFSKGKMHNDDDL